MRFFLTFIAIALVSALTFVFVIPYVVDWTGQRENLARVMSAHIGQPVEINGAVTLRLLPSSFLDVADVTIGPHTAPLLTAQTLRLEFNPWALLTGQLQLDDIALDKPLFALRPSFPLNNALRLAAGHVRISHAQVRWERPGHTPLIVKDLNFEGRAAELLRGEGHFQLGDTQAHYQISAQTSAPMITLAIETDRLQADFKGQFSTDDSTDELGLKGYVQISGQIPNPRGSPWPYSVRGALSAKSEWGQISQMQWQLGEEGRALEGQGDAVLKDYDTPNVSARLVSDSLNLDAWLRDKALYATPAQALAVAQSLLTQAESLTSLALHVRAQQAYLGARRLEKPVLEAVSTDHGVALRLNSGLPTRGHIQLTAAAPLSHAHVQLETDNIAALVEWGMPDLERFVAALPEEHIAMQGDLDVSGGSYAWHNLDLGLGPSHFTGAAVYNFAKDKGRLKLDLASEALDIATLPHFKAMQEELRDLDLELNLTAKKLYATRVAHAGSLALSLSRAGEAWTLHKLSLHDFGGANLEAQGTLSRAQAHIVATQMHDFSALITYIWPNSLLQSLLQPLQFVDAHVSVENGLRVEGRASGATFALNITPSSKSADTISAQAFLKLPAANDFLLNIGLCCVAPSPTPIKLGFEGVWQAGEDNLRLSGPLSVQGAFIELGADCVAHDEGVEINNLRGTLGGVKLAGNLSWGVSVKGELPRITGTLALDHLALQDPTKLWLASAPTDVDIAFKIGQLNALRDVSGRLIWGPGHLALEQTRFALNGGHVAVGVDLHQSSTLATVTSHVNLENISLAALNMQARFDAGLDVVGSGASVPALLGSLAGQGQLHLHEAHVFHSDPHALARIMEMPKPNMLKSLTQELSQELDKGTLDLAASDSPLRIVAGTALWGPLGQGDNRLWGRTSLVDLSQQLKLVQHYAGPFSRFWNTGPTEIVITMRPPSARDIDVNNLRAGLSAEAIAQEKDRLKNLEKAYLAAQLRKHLPKGWAVPTYP